MFDNKKGGALMPGHRFNRSLLAASIMALSVPAFAQTNNSATAEVEEVVVTGMRNSIQNAQDLKRNSDTVIDAITATDIGALPDKSVTEALQRVPGVTIERFASSEDPNHFADEGTGVLVRGLDRVRSEINGRDAFSANPWGTLNFEDIPPELLGAVEVIKNQTADRISGGIAGTVNLVTRKPFDSDGRVVAASAKASYGDMRETVTPVVSALFSDRWETNAGEFGFLVSAIRSELETRGDGIGVGNFYSRGPGENADGGPLNGFENQQVYMPGVISIRTANNDRSREGFGSSLQWQNADETIVATVEYIKAEAELITREYVVYSPYEQGFVVGGNTAINISTNPDDADFTTVVEDGFFKAGALDSGLLWYNTRFNDTDNQVEDASFNLKLRPTDKLTIDLDMQRVDSSNTVMNNSFMTQSTGSRFYVDLRGSSPTIEYLSPSVRNPNTNGAAATNTNFIRSLLEQNVDNDAKMEAYSADVAYEIDDNWITGVKAGVYYADKDLVVRDTEYSNWGVVGGCGWCAGGPGFSGTSADFSQSPTEFEKVAFNNFYRGSGIKGDTNEFWFAKMSSVEDLVATTLRGYENGWMPYGTGSQWLRNDRIPGTPFAPNHVGSVNEERQEAYVRVDYAFDDLAVPLKGNLGLRQVNYQLTSTGFENYPTLSNNASLYPQNVQDFATGGSSEGVTVKGTDYSTVLPTFNLSASLQDDLIARFAISKGLYYPSLTDTRNIKVMQISKTDVTDPDDPTQVIGVTDVQLTGQAKNPFLEPEESVNIDVTLEWYFNKTDSVTASLFHKKLDNIIRERAFAAPVTNNGVTLPGSFSGPVNEGSGEIQGIELSYTQFYDSLPGAWSGLGLQVNYTYIDQKDINDPQGIDVIEDIRLGVDGQPLPVDGRNSFRSFTNLPLPSYSDNTFNITGMYEYADISARLAYNWRSEYLITRRDSDWFAPVYAKDTGYLDGSVFYTLNENIKVGLEVSNLLNTETRTMNQLNQAGDKTDGLNFVTDRRYAFTVRAQF